MQHKRLTAFVHLLMAGHIWYNDIWVSMLLGGLLMYRANSWYRRDGLSRQHACVLAF